MSSDGRGMDSGGFDGCVSVKESDDASSSMNSNVDASTSLNSNVSCGTVVAKCAFPCDCRVVFVLGGDADSGGISGNVHSGNIGQEVKAVPVVATVDKQH